MSPRLLRPTPPSSFALFGLLLAMTACGSDFGIGGGINVGGFGFGGSGVGGIEDPPPGAAPPGRFSYEALCGVNDTTCVPGDLTVPCPSPEGAGGAGGAASGGGSVGGGAIGGGAVGGATAQTSVACQVLDVRGAPSASCAAAGDKTINAVCNDSSECAPGLGCVLAAAPTNEGGGQPGPAVGLCQAYCCGDIEAGCPDPNTYCAPQPLFDAAAQLPEPKAALPVPVCSPIEPCTLLGSGCPTGETCAIVRDDGTAGCVTEGGGGLCQPCPCAAGFTCNFGTGTCVKLCDTNTNDCPGADAICQGGYPDNIGICVGGDAACR